MASEQLRVVARQLRELARGHGDCQTPDHELLGRFVKQGSESDFETLVHRHGAMVLHVGQRLMHNQHDAEDIFQATFLTLARKAGSVRKLGSIACWLHGVARRMALQMQAARARRAHHEGRLAERMPADPPAEITLREAQVVLDEALGSLSEKYRAPLVLCYLEGATRDEAARQLRVSLATVKRRLDRGRDLLRVRLTRRGLTVPATLAAALLADGAAPASVSTVLSLATVRAALLLNSGKPLTAGLLSARAITLTEGMIRTMSITKLKVAALCMTLAIAATGAAVFVHQAWADSMPEQQAQLVGRDAPQSNRDLNEQAGPAPADVTPQAVQEKSVPSAKADDSGKDTNHFIFTVHTDLQKELQQSADVYVVLDAAAALKDGKITLRELHLEELKNSLLPYKKADTQLDFNLFFKGQVTQDVDQTSTLRYAMIGFGHWIGFPKVRAGICLPARETTWKEYSAAFTSKQRQPKGDEPATTNKFVKAYPVRTEFSRYLTDDADCAVVILPTLAEDKGTIPQTVREAIVDAVDKLKISHKKQVSFFLRLVVRPRDEEAQLNRQFWKLAEDMGFETSIVHMR